MDEETKPTTAIETSLPLARPPLGARLKALFEEYGPLALTLYLILFVVVYAGFMVVIAVGVRAKTTAGSFGLVGAAWVATKLTQPIRIIATLALVPLVARLRPPRTPRA